MKRSHLFLRSISFALLQTFILQQISYADVLSPVKQDIFKKPSVDLVLPPSVALIEDTYKADSSLKTFYLIQDAHTNESGQLNLAKSLDILLNKQKDLKLVFTEAGVKDNSLSFLRKNKPLKERQKLALSYVKQGLLHGAEYLDLTSEHDFTLWGVEDASLYTKALNDYKNVASQRERFDLYLKKIYSTLTTLEDRLLNPSLHRFNKDLQAFESEKITLTDFFNVLLRESALSNLSLTKYPHLNTLKALKDKEETIDFEKANKEQITALNSLSLKDQEELKDLTESQKNSPFKLTSSDSKEQKAFYALLEEKLKSHALDYPELFKYFGYLKLAQELKAKNVLLELDLLKEELLSSLYKSEDEKTLIQCQKIQGYLKKLFYFTLTPEEFKDYKDLSSSFDLEHLTGFLNKKIMDLNTYYDRSLFLEEGYKDMLRSSEEFYTLTADRDSHFIEESLLKMDKEGQSKAALITGGFHTQNLKALLKSKNISYISITPQVLKETNLKRYENILLGPLTTRSGLALSAAPSKFMTGQAISVLKSLIPAPRDTREAIARVLGEFQLNRASLLSTGPTFRERRPAFVGARLALNIEKIEAKIVKTIGDKDTVRVDIDVVDAATGKKGHGHYVVPAGTSAGAFERAVSETMAKVLAEITLIQERIAKEGLAADDLVGVGQLMLKMHEQEGIFLGAQATLGVQGALARAVADSRGKMLAAYVRDDLAPDLARGDGFQTRGQANITNGGAHADNDLDMQEFMVVAYGATQAESRQMTLKVDRNLGLIYQALGLFADPNDGGVGDMRGLEGGYKIKDLTSKKLAQIYANRDAIKKAAGNILDHLDLDRLAAEKVGVHEFVLEALGAAVLTSGYKFDKSGEVGSVAIALDPATNEMKQLDKKDKWTGYYFFEGRRINHKELTQIFLKWSRKFPILSIEDGQQEEAWDAWLDMIEAFADTGVTLIGDDLLVTQGDRVHKLLQLMKKRGMLNPDGTIKSKYKIGILIKVNQNGFITTGYNDPSYRFMGTLEVIRYARKMGFQVIDMSHRSKEALPGDENSLISHLAAAVDAEFAKIGDPIQPTRDVFWRALVDIENAEPFAAEGDLDDIGPLGGRLTQSAEPTAENIFTRLGLSRGKVTVTRVGDRNVMVHIFNEKDAQTSEFAPYATIGGIEASVDSSQLTALAEELGRYLAVHIDEDFGVVSKEVSRIIVQQASGQTASEKTTTGSATGSAGLDVDTLLKNIYERNKKGDSGARLSTRTGFERPEGQAKTFFTNVYTQFTLSDLLKGSPEVISDEVLGAIRSYLDNEVAKKHIKSYTVFNWGGTDVDIHVTHNYGKYNVSVHGIILNALRAGLSQANKMGLLKQDASTLLSADLAQATYMRATDEHSITERGSESVGVVKIVGGSLGAANIKLFHEFAMPGSTPLQKLGLNKAPGFIFVVRPASDVLNGVQGKEWRFEISHEREIKDKKTGAVIRTIPSVNQTIPLLQLLSQPNDYVLVAVYPVEGGALPASEPVASIPLPVFGTNGKRVLNTTILIRLQSGADAVGGAGSVMEAVNFVPGGPDGGNFVATKPTSMNDARRVPQTGQAALSYYGYQSHISGRIPVEQIVDHIGVNPPALRPEQLLADKLAKVMSALVDHLPFKAPHKTIEEVEDTRHAQDHLFTHAPKESEPDDALAEVEAKVKSGALVRFIEEKADMGGTWGHTQVPTWMTAFYKATLLEEQENGNISFGNTFGSVDNNQLKDDENWGVGDDGHMFMLGDKSTGGMDSHQMAFMAFTRAYLFSSANKLPLYGEAQDFLGAEAKRAKSNPYFYAKLTPRFFQLLRQVMPPKYLNLVLDVEDGKGPMNIIDRIEEGWKQWQKTGQSIHTLQDTFSGNVSQQGIGWAAYPIDPKTERTVDILAGDKMGPAALNPIIHHAMVAAVDDTNTKFANGLVVEIWDAKAFDPKGNIAIQDIPTSFKDVETLSYKKDADKTTVEGSYDNGVLKTSLSEDELRTLADALKRNGYVPAKRIFLDAKEDREAIVKYLADSDRFNVKHVWSKKSSGWDINNAQAYLDRPVLGSSVTRLGILAGGEYVGKDDPVMVGHSDFMKYVYDFLRTTPILIQGDMNGSHWLWAVPTALQNSVATKDSHPIFTMLRYYLSEDGKALTKVEDLTGRPDFNEINEQALQFNHDFKIAQLGGQFQPLGTHVSTVEASYDLARELNNLNKSSNPLLTSNRKVSGTMVGPEIPADALKDAVTGVTGARLSTRTGFERPEGQAKTFFTNVYTQFTLSDLLKGSPEVISDEVLGAIRSYLDNEVAKKHIKSYTVFNWGGTDVDIHVTHNYGKYNVSVHGIILNALRAGLSQANKMGLLKQDASTLLSADLAQATYMRATDEHSITERGSESVGVVKIVGGSLGAANIKLFHEFAMPGSTPLQKLGLNKAPGFIFVVRPASDVLNGVQGKEWRFEISHEREIKDKKTGAVIRTIPSVNQTIPLLQLLSQPNDYVLVAVYPVEGGALPASEPVASIPLPVFGTNGKRVLNTTILIRLQSGADAVGGAGSVMEAVNFVPGGPDGGNFVATKPTSMNDARRVPQTGQAALSYYGYQSHISGRIPVEQIVDHIGVNPPALRPEQLLADKLAKVMSALVDHLPFKAPHKTIEEVEDTRHAQDHLFTHAPKESEPDDALAEVEAKVKSGALVRFIEEKADMGGTWGHTQVPTWMTAFYKATLLEEQENGNISFGNTFGSVDNNQLKDDENWGVGDDGHMFMLGDKSTGGMDSHQMAFMAFTRAYLFSSANKLPLYGEAQDFLGAEAKRAKSNPYFYAKLTPRFFQLLRQVMPPKYLNLVLDVEDGKGPMNIIDRIEEGWKQWQKTGQSIHTLQDTFSGNVSQQGIGWAAYPIDPKTERTVDILAGDKMGPAALNPIIHHAMVAAVDDTNTKFANGLVVEIWDAKAFDPKGNIAIQDIPTSFKDVETLSYKKDADKTTVEGSYDNGVLKTSLSEDELRTLADALKRNGYVPAKRIFLDAKEDREAIVKYLADSDRFNVKHVWSKKSSGWDINNAQAYLDRPVLGSSVTRLGILAGGEYVGKDDPVMVGHSDFMKYVYDFLRTTPILIQGDMNGSHWLWAVPTALQNSVATKDSHPIFTMLRYYLSEDGKALTKVEDLTGRPDFNEINEQALQFNHDFKIAQLGGQFQPLGTHVSTVEASYDLARELNNLNKSSNPLLTSNRKVSGTMVGPEIPADALKDAVTGVTGARLAELPAQLKEHPYVLVPASDVSLSEEQIKNEDLYTVHDATGKLNYVYNPIGNAVQIRPGDKPSDYPGIGIGVIFHSETREYLGVTVEQARAQAEEFLKAGWRVILPFGDFPANLKGVDYLANGLREFPQTDNAIREKFSKLTTNDRLYREYQTLVSTLDIIKGTSLGEIKNTFSDYIDALGLKDNEDRNQVVTLLVAELSTISEIRSQLPVLLNGFGDHLRSGRILLPYEPIEGIKGTAISPELAKFRYQFMYATIAATTGLHEDELSDLIYGGGMNLANMAKFAKFSRGGFIGRASASATAPEGKDSTSALAKAAQELGAKIGKRILLLLNAKQFDGDALPTHVAAYQAGNIDTAQVKIVHVLPATDVNAAQIALRDSETGRALFENISAEALPFSIAVRGANGIATQEVTPENKGALTSHITAANLKKMGVSYVVFSKEDAEVPYYQAQAKNLAGQGIDTLVEDSHTSDYMSALNLEELKITIAGRTAGGRTARPIVASLSAAERQDLMRAYTPSEIKELNIVVLVPLAEVREVRLLSGARLTSNTTKASSKPNGVEVSVEVTRHVAGNAVSYNTTVVFNKTTTFTFDLGAAVATQVTFNDLARAVLSRIQNALQSKKLKLNSASLQRDVEAAARGEFEKDKAKAAAATKGARLSMDSALIQIAQSNQTALRDVRTLAILDIHELILLDLQIRQGKDKGTALFVSRDGKLISQLNLNDLPKEQIRQAKAQIGALQDVITQIKTQDQNTAISLSDVTLDPAKKALLGIDLSRFDLNSPYTFDILAGQLVQYSRTPQAKGTLVMLLGAPQQVQQAGARLAELKAKYGLDTRMFVTESPRDSSYQTLNLLAPEAIRPIEGQLSLPLDRVVGDTAVNFTPIIMLSVHIARSSSNPAQNQYIRQTTEVLVGHELMPGIFDDILHGRASLEVLRQNILRPILDAFFKDMAQFYRASMSMLRAA